MCSWCMDPNSEEDDPTKLCRMHEAEQQGLSVSELDRRDREQGAEYLDAY